MKTAPIIAVILLMTTSLFAGSPADKVSKLYDKGKYEKCITVAEDAIDNGKQAPEVLLYHMLANLQVFKANKGFTPALDKALISAAQLSKTKSGKQLLQENAIACSSLYTLTQEYADNLLSNGHTPTAGNYYNYLVVIYKDTTDNYREILALSTQPEEIVPVIPAYEVAPVDMTEVPEMDSLALLKEALLDYSSALVGIPYCYGCSSGVPGFDCSGFTSYVYENVGVDLPRSSFYQSKLGTEIPLEEANTGDLVFFGKKKGKDYSTSHVAMVYKNDEGDVQIIHSTSSRGVVIESSQEESWNSYWGKKFLFVKRILD